MNDRKQTEGDVKQQPKDQRLPAGELDQEQLDQAAGGMSMMISLAGFAGKVIKSTTEAAATTLTESPK